MSCLVQHVMYVCIYQSNNLSGYLFSFICIYLFLLFIISLSTMNALFLCYFNFFTTSNNRHISCYVWLNVCMNVMWRSRFNHAFFSCTFTFFSYMIVQKMKIKQKAEAFHYERNNHDLLQNKEKRRLALKRNYRCSLQQIFFYIVLISTLTLWSLS